MAAASSDPRFIRTTVSLREDLYQRLKRQDRSLSDAINELLDDSFQRDHSLFGTAPPSPRDDIRDRQDRV